jgi:hypothetical protein
MSDAPICAQCGTAGRQTAPVAIVLVFAPGFPDHEPCWFIAPSENYPLCDAEPNGEACPSVGAFVRLAIESHPVTRKAGQWTSVVICFKDPERRPWLIDAHAKAQASA